MNSVGKDLTRSRRTWMLQDLKEAKLVSAAGTPSAYALAVASGMSQERAAKPWNKYGQDITVWPRHEVVRYWEALHSVSDGRTEGELVEAVWRVCAERECHLFQLVLRRTVETGLTSGTRDGNLLVTPRGMSLMTGIPVERLGETLPRSEFMLAAANGTGTDNALLALYILGRDRGIIE